MSSAVATQRFAHHSGAWEPKCQVAEAHEQGIAEEVDAEGAVDGLCAAAQALAHDAVCRTPVQLLLVQRVLQQRLDAPEHTMPFSFSNHDHARCALTACLHKICNLRTAPLQPCLDSASCSVNDDTASMLQNDEKLWRQQQESVAPAERAALAHARKLLRGEPAVRGGGVLLLQVVLHGPFELCWPLLLAWPRAACKYSSRSRCQF
jgi:hypothetical protein